MDGGVDKLLGLLENGRIAGASGELMLKIVDELNLAVDRRVFNTILTQGAITPDAAVQAWSEKLAYARIAAKIEQTKAAGLAAGRKLDPAMNKTPWMGSASTPSTENGGYDGPGHE